MAQYIDKDAVVAEIERKLKEYRTFPDYQTDSNYMELCEILSFLNTLETKEVDLNSESAWKPADGDDLPEIDREVIALLEDGKVVFAHRPPEYWDGKNIITNEVTRYYPKRYDGGGWNQPNVKWWLDSELPKIEE